MNRLLPSTLRRKELKFDPRSVDEESRSHFKKESSSDIGRLFEYSPG